MELQHFSHDEHPLFFREIIPNEDDEEACRCNGCLEVISGAYYGCSQYLDRVDEVRDSFVQFPCLDSVGGFRYLLPLSVVVCRLPCSLGFAFTPSVVCGNIFVAVCVRSGVTDSDSDSDSTRKVYEMWVNMKLENLLTLTLEFRKWNSVPQKGDQKTRTESEMELQHFSHSRHPLFLREFIPNEDGGDEKARRCNGCSEVISNAYFGCSQCKFFLHKLCAELPQVMEHHMHPEHPLALVVESYCMCNVCDKCWKNFAYRCSECYFVVDIMCASG
ncbi:hypothetical protein RJ639_042720 [Escallonia herrerae]|uniref:DC1 domain-containing protein n=1 Tax=Escallonia herrerae TaxID=1293975 RepID=A0AA88WDK8_9ASTE|nr:hypothetical protein RJ639_042720 [Escallonia herrerae]